MKVRTYTDEQKAEIVKFVSEKLMKSMDVNRHGVGIPLWMNISFILDKFNRGNYYGTISLKMLGTSCADARELDVSHKLYETYTDFNE